MSTPQRTQRTHTTHYVDNAELTRLLTEYSAACKQAAELKLPKPKMSDKLGRMLMRVATRLASARNFNGYPFKEDMISDGLETLVRYAHNYDPAKSSNGFSYVTTILYFAYLRRIKVEGTSYRTLNEYRRDRSVHGVTNERNDTGRRVDTINRSDQ